MKIACSTSAWRGDLEYALARVRALGFQFVDLNCIAAWNHITADALATNYEAELERVRRLLSRYRLKPIAANLGIRPPLFDREPPNVTVRNGNTERFCRLMNDLGISVGGYFPGARKRDGIAEEIYGATVQSIADIARIAKDHCLSIGPEIHWNSNVETIAEGCRLLADLPELTITYDPSHFIMQGEPIERTMPFLLRAHHVHLRSAAPQRLQASLDEARDAVRWILRALMTTGYSGNISIEYLPSDTLDVEAEIPAMRDFIEKDAEERK